MSKYLIEGTYAAEGAKGLLKQGGTSRQAQIKAMVDGLGGSARGLLLGVRRVRLLRHRRPARQRDRRRRTALTVSGSGAVRTRTTVLLTPEEIDQAQRRTVDYRAPGA